MVGEIKVARHILKIHLYQKNKNNKPYETRINSLLNEIISYPIESKSLVDNTIFLIGIKNTAIKIKNSI